MRQPESVHHTCSKLHACHRQACEVCTSAAGPAIPVVLIINTPQLPVTVCCIEIADNSSRCRLVDCVSPAINSSQPQVWFASTAGCSEHWAAHSPQAGHNSCTLQHAASSGPCDELQCTLKAEAGQYAVPSIVAECCNPQTAAAAVLCRLQCDTLHRYPIH